jgi:hypothetical protein
MRARSAVLAVLLATACNGVGPFEGGSTGDLAIAPQGVVLGAIGAQRQLGLTDGDGDAIDGDGAVWRSSDPGIVAVDGSGTVTASGDGQATITAELGAREATTVVTVAATIELTIEVTATDQADADLDDNRVVTTITVQAP